MSERHHTGTGSFRRTFLFDADCGICTDTVAWMMLRGAGGSMDFVPYQRRPEAMVAAKLTDEDCRHAAFVVEPRAGRLRIHRGAAAINAGLRATTGIGNLHWRIAGRLYPLPGLRHIEDLVYGWVANNRHRFSREGQTCPIEGA